MNTKALVAGVIGGLCFFLLGFLLYGMLMSNAFNACLSCQRPHDEINFLILGLGNLFFGFLLAYIFSRWAGISTFRGGLTGGAMIGLLMSLGGNLAMYATSTIYTSYTCVAYDVIIMIIMVGITGGVVAWWLGRK